MPKGEKSAELGLGRWQDHLIDGIKPQGKDTVRYLSTMIPHEVIPLINASARERDISLTAYIRRAACSFAVFDQGADWDTVMQQEPHFRGFDNQGYELRALRGRGAGNWKIVDLGNYGNA